MIYSTTLDAILMGCVFLGFVILVVLGLRYCGKE